MTIVKYIWGKWQGIVQNNDRYNLLLILSEIGNQEHCLIEKCSVEDLHRKFHSENSINTGNWQLNCIIENYDPTEKSMLDKWINFMTPRLIDIGISKGYWSK